MVRSSVELIRIAESYEAEAARVECGAREIDLRIAASRARAQAAYWARREEVGRG